MSSFSYDIDTLLSTVVLDSNDSSGSLDDSSVGSNEESEGWHESEYQGSIDYRIRQLSYSSRQLLNSCPRKFQLQRLRTSHRTEQSERSTITFAFGHVVGEAIQLALQDLSEDEVIWRSFLGWHTDLFAQDERAGKSFWECITAYRRFKSARDSGFLQDYELVYYQDRPACELSFCINFPDGFRYRGFVDAVLKHSRTGEIIVLECKTTGMATVNPAQYKNSAQGIGYSIVLDHLFPDLSSYQVLYLVYQTKSREFLPIPFHKTYLQRALWIRELLLDIERIKSYEEAEVYPMNGDSCTQWSRLHEGDKTWQGDCEYLQTCTLSTKYLTNPAKSTDEDKTDYQVSISLLDLLETQLEKVS